MSDWNFNETPECLTEELADPFYAPESYRTNREFGRWEHAIRRLASKFGCYVYVMTLSEEMTTGNDEIRASAVMYAVGLGYVVSDGTAYPMRKQMVEPETDKDSCVMKLLAPTNFGAGEQSVKMPSIEEACEDWLRSAAGKTLGVGDSDTSAIGGYGNGYIQEIFTPVVTVPEFSSLPELELKLTAMGA